MRRRERGGFRGATDDDKGDYPRRRVYGGVYESQGKRRKNAAGAEIRPDVADFLAVELQLFGPFAAFVRGEPLPRLRSRKGHYLLALLDAKAGARGFAGMAGGDAVAGKFAGTGLL